jgi:hypothetical protein
VLEKPVSLKDIVKLVEITRTREMNFFDPWPVYDLLMTKPAIKWEKICLDAFAAVEKHLRNIVKESSVLVFQRFETGGLAYAAQYLQIETLHLTI